MIPPPHPTPHPRMFPPFLPGARRVGGREEQPRVSLSSIINRGTSGVNTDSENDTIFGGNPARGLKSEKISGRPRPSHGPSLGRSVGQVLTLEGTFLSSSQRSESRSFLSRWPIGPGEQKLSSQEQSPTKQGSPPGRKQLWKQSENIKGAKRIWQPPRLLGEFPLCRRPKHLATQLGGGKWKMAKIHRRNYLIS